MLSEILLKVASRLKESSETPSLDAQVLLSHVLCQEKTWVLAHPEVELSANQQRVLQDAMELLEAGKPLPYVLGHWEFFGLDMLLTPDVLIPRPETELLVEQALEWLTIHGKRRKALDIGSGSGCIAVSMAVHIQNLFVTACDISLPALHVTKSNATRHGVIERIACIQCDMLPPASTGFDLICANLPYIPSHMLNMLRVAQNEPRLALDGGSDGLSLIQRLLAEAPLLLSPGGLLLLEIEETQGRAVQSLARSAFPEAEIRVLSDLAGRDRILRVASSSD